MKHAVKMMLVPYVKPLERPSEDFLNNLDSQMSSILANTMLNFEDKIKLYNQTLFKFIKNYDSEMYGVAPIYSTKH